MVRSKSAARTRRSRFPLMGAAVAAAAAIAVSGCGSVDEPAATTASGGPVKIGLQVPQSGPYQSIGTTQKQAAELYVRAHDGRMGGREVELVVQDEGANATESQSAMRKLIADGAQVVTGIVNPATTQAVAPLAERARLPAVALTYSVVPAPNWWAVSYGLEGEFASLAKYLASRTDRLYMITGDTTSGRGIQAGLAAAYRAAGGTVLGAVFSPAGASDFQPYLSKVKASGADAVFAWYAGSEAVSFVKQWASFGLGKQAQLYGISLTQEPLLEAQGDAALGTRVHNTYSPTLEGHGNPEFVAAYRDAYGVNPDEFAEWQYSAMAAIDDALSAVDGDVSREKIAAAVRGLDWIESPRGRWRFGDGNRPDQHYFITEVRRKDGELVNDMIVDLGFWTADGRAVANP